MTRNGVREGFYASILQARILHLFFLDREMTDSDFKNGCEELRNLVGLNNLQILVRKLSNDPKLHNDDYFEEIERCGYDRSRFVAQNDP